MRPDSQTNGQQARTGPLAVRLAALGLCAIGLCTAPLAALPTDRNNEVEIEVPRQRRQQRAVKELLGLDRWQRLEAARFDFDLQLLNTAHGRSEDPVKLDELEDVFMSSLLRLGQKRIQGSLRLIERRDEMRSRLRAGSQAEKRRPGLHLSPGVRVGTASSFGVKLRLRGLRSPLWSRTSLRLRREVDGRNASVKLAFRDHRISSYLVYDTEHEKRGESVELGLRFTF